MKKTNPTSENERKLNSLIYLIIFLAFIFILILQLVLLLVSLFKAADLTNQVTYIFITFLFFFGFEIFWKLFKNLHLFQRTKMEEELEEDLEGQDDDEEDEESEEIEKISSFSKFKESRSRRLALSDELTRSEFSETLPSKLRSDKKKFEETASPKDFTSESMRIKQEVDNDLMASEALANESAKIEKKLESSNPKELPLKLEKTKPKVQAPINTVKLEEAEKSVGKVEEIESSQSLATQSGTGNRKVAELAKSEKLAAKLAKNNIKIDDIEIAAEGKIETKAPQFPAKTNHFDESPSELIVKKSPSPKSQPEETPSVKLPEITQIKDVQEQKLKLPKEFKLSELEGLMQGNPAKDLSEELKEKPKPTEIKAKPQVRKKPKEKRLITEAKESQSLKEKKARAIATNQKNRALKKQELAATNKSKNEESKARTDIHEPLSPKPAQLTGQAKTSKAKLQEKEFKDLKRSEEIKLSKTVKSALPSKAVQKEEGQQRLTPKELKTAEVQKTSKAKLQEKENTTESIEFSNLEAVKVPKVSKAKLQAKKAQKKVSNLSNPEKIETTKVKISQEKKAGIKERRKDTGQPIVNMEGLKTVKEIRKSSLPKKALKKHEETQPFEVSLSEISKSNKEKSKGNSPRGNYQNLIEKLEDLLDDVD